MIICRAAHLFCLTAAALACLVLSPDSARAQFRIDPATQGETMLGPKAAKGVVVWSHGRSVTSEDSLSPTPSYMAVLHQAGWDTLRFNRMRDSDTLQDSSRELVARVAQLKQQGYRHIVLAGQSYGAFLSLMAADASDDVYAVVATSPAAYGSFTDFYQSWESNATQLYPLLANVRRARVMLFYFHGDDFDPGGRGEHSKAILAEHNIDNLVVDQPPQLTGHWAASTGLFVRRFGGCIRDFIEAESTGNVACNSSWGEKPSEQIAFPAHFHNVSATTTNERARAFAGKWYGFYGNGREVEFAIEHVSGNEVTAIYAVGPGIKPDEKAEWVRRTGHIVGDEIVFNEKGLNVLRYHLLPDGRLQDSWRSLDGKASLEATLRRTDTADVPHTTTAGGAQ
ncbi:MAG: alpha/beta hydrolase [Alphaproteobacteria bacterium]|nr:alpha/beta hydrolase [Alphaproteobacteria bacterium]